MTCHRTNITWIDPFLTKWVKIAISTSDISVILHILNCLHSQSTKGRSNRILLVGRQWSFPVCGTSYIKLSPTGKFHLHYRLFSKWCIYYVTCSCSGQISINNFFLILLVFITSYFKKITWKVAHSDLFSKTFYSYSDGSVICVYVYYQDFRLCEHVNHTCSGLEGVNLPIVNILVLKVKHMV